MGRPKSASQEALLCGSEADHEQHTWRTDPDLWCMGVTNNQPNAFKQMVNPAQNPEEAHAYADTFKEDRPPPDFAQCRHTYKQRPCVLEQTHTQHSVEHQDEAGTKWPVHAPFVHPDCTGNASCRLHGANFHRVADIDVLENDVVVVPEGLPEYVEKLKARIAELEEHEAAAKRTVQQCDSTNAHGDHDYGVFLHCDGIKAHPKTMIGRAGYDFDGKQIGGPISDIDGKQAR